MDEVKRTAADTHLSMADAMRQAIQFGLPQVRQGVSRESDLAEAAAETWERLGSPPTIEGKPKARLTRANVVPGNGASPERPVDLTVRVKELASLREEYRTGKAGLTVDQILEESRADRP